MSHAIATATALKYAARKTDRNPSDAAKEAGNYAKGKFNWRGETIAIENPKGSMRSGTDKNGKRWQCRLPATYGYLLGTRAVDGDHVDCYIGDAHDSQKVWVVDQIDLKTKSYDEPKCMLDFPSKEAAVEAYTKAFSDGRGKDRIGSVTEMSVPEFRAWANSSAAKKPLAKGYATGGSVMSQKPSQAVAAALDTARRYGKRASGGRVGYEDGGVSPADLTRDILPPRAHSPVPDYLLQQQKEGIPGAKMPALGGTQIRDLIRAYERESMRRRAAMSVPEQFSDMGERLGDVGRNVKDTAGALLPDWNPEAETARLSKPGTIGENLTEFAKQAPGKALAVAPYAGNAERLAAGPAGRSLMEALYSTAPRVGATTLAAGAPDFINAAQSGNPAEARQSEIAKLEKDIAAHRKAITDLTKNTIESKVRGKPEEANKSRELAITANSKPYNDAISAAQSRINELQTANDADAKEAEARGAPLRESLPPVMSKTVPIWTGAIGAMATRGVFNKWNAEYNQALKSFQSAEKQMDPVQMAVRQAQLKQLEANTPWKNPLTYLAAGIPAELRMSEHAIDMRNDPESRGYKEANARQHDPMAIGVDAGTNLLSAATALGLGAKFSKNQPERSLGQAIAVPKDPYGGAPDLANQYGTALQAGEALRSQYPNGPTGPVEQRGILQRLLGTAPGKASGVPGTTVGPQTSAPSLPELRALPDYRSAAGPPPSAEGPPSLSAPALPTPDVVYRGKDKLGRTFHKDDAGLYTSNPKAAKSKDTAKPLLNGKDTSSPSKGNGKGTSDDEVGHKSGGVVQKALALARKYASGGRVHVGAMPGATGGRDDKLPVSVPSGSYILPADAVSGWPGAGNNTAAGFKILEATFGKSQRPGAAQGGATPIMISDGEFILSPDQVAKVGGGSLEKGHAMLDGMVRKVRADHVRTLSQLPGPAR